MLSLWSKQIEKTVKDRQRIRMLLTQHRFPERKCLSMHLFDFFIFALAAQHPGQIIHTRQHRWMLLG